MANEGPGTLRQDEIAFGVYLGLRKFFGLLCAIFLVVLLLMVLWALTPFGRDPTDEHGWFGKRSDMGFKVDHGTGCQYLTHKDGSMIPRVDTQGRHICARN